MSKREFQKCTLKVNLNESVLSAEIKSMAFGIERGFDSLSPQVPVRLCTSYFFF